MPKTISFTGHRPSKLGGFTPNNPIAMKIKNQLEKQINLAISDGFTYFISGGALGVDQWAAEIIIRLKETNQNLKLIIAKPFPSQSKVWNDDAKSIFENICKKADSVVDVCDEPYAAWKLQKRNEWMVDHSDKVIAVWDGTVGGTANCVNYAKKKLKTIIQINPNDKN
jgi:uncharacterized phage-like protein YoqJ